MDRRAVAVAMLLALALGTAGAGSAAASPSRQQEPREAGSEPLATEPDVTIDSPADLSVLQVGSVVVLTARVRGGVDRCTVGWGDGASTVAAAGQDVCSAGHRYLTRGTHDVTVTASSPAGSAEDAVTVVLADPAATVVGAGSVGGTSFGLAAAPTSFGPVGDVGIRTADGHVFHGTPLAVVVTGRTSTWWGAGRLDTTGPCGFLVTVVDAGPRGDRVRLVVTSPAGTTLVHAAGPLTAGRVDVRPWVSRG